MIKLHLNCSRCIQFFIFHPFYLLSKAVSNKKKIETKFVLINFRLDEMMNLLLKKNTFFEVWYIHYEVIIQLNVIYFVAKK